MDQRTRGFHHRAISPSGSCLHAQLRHRTALQDGRLKGKKRHGSSQRSRPAKRRQFRQPKVRVPEEARGCQASSSREQPWKSVLKLSPEVRISSKRPKLSSRSTASRSSTPRKANAAGRQSPLMARRMSAARRKFSGLIAKPMPPSPIGARARQPRDPGPRSANRPRSRQKRGRFWKGVMTNPPGCVS